MVPWLANGTGIDQVPRTDGHIYIRMVRGIFCCKERSIFVPFVVPLREATLGVRVSKERQLSPHLL